MLPRSALVASGLQALVCNSVTGTRNSAERKLPSRKSGACTITCIFCLKSSVLVHAQYAFQQVRYSGPAQPFGSSPGAGLGALLEWQRAQVSANTVFPRSTTAESGSR